VARQQTLESLSLNGLARIDRFMDKGKEILGNYAQAGDLFDL
jgi:hypothetical protein